jgi:hypothetical protein
MAKKVRHDRFVHKGAERRELKRLVDIQYSLAHKYYDLKSRLPEIKRLERMLNERETVERMSNPTIPSSWTTARVRRLPGGRLHVQLTGRRKRPGNRVKR